MSVVVVSCANYDVCELLFAKCFCSRGILRRVKINIVLNFRLNMDLKTFLHVILGDFCQRSLNLKIHNVRT